MQTRVLDAAHWLGEAVYLRVASEPRKGLVTGLIVRPGVTLYLVVWATGDESAHYDFELSAEHVRSFEGD